MAIQCAECGRRLSDNEVTFGVTRCGACAGELATQAVDRSLSPATQPRRPSICSRCGQPLRVNAVGDGRGRPTTYICPSCGWKVDDNARFERSIGESPVQQAIHHLVARLDQPGRRYFIAYTLSQRRPYLHRFFVSASRRANLAHMNEARRSFSSLQKEIKKRGHEDEELCRQAAGVAQLFSPGGVVTAIGGDAVLELARAAGGAASAATITADDIAAYKAGSATREAAELAAENSLSVIRTAHLIDARASGRMASAVASASAQGAIEKAQKEQLKWLRRRLGE